jgi:hypothetical protein
MLARLVAPRRRIDLIRCWLWRSCTGHDLGLWRAAADAALIAKDHAAAVEALQKIG